MNVAQIKALGAWRYWCAVDPMGCRRGDTVTAANVVFSFAKQCIRNAAACTPEGWTIPTAPSYWRRQALASLKRAIVLRGEVTP